MKKDHRLSLKAPSILKYEQEQKEKQDEFTGRYSRETWKPWIEQMALTILGTIDSRYIPSNINIEISDEKIGHGLTEVKMVLLSNSGLIDTNKENLYAISVWLGEVLAEIVAEDFSVWESLYNIIGENYVLYQSWIEKLPNSSIIENKEEIMSLPSFKHPLELVTTWGYLREEKYWESFSENLAHDEQNAIDAWDYVVKSIDYNNEMELKPILKFKCDILYKVDKILWLKWVSRLPNLQIKESALSDIQSLDEWVFLLESIFHIQKAESSFEKKELERLAALFLWEFFEVCKRISGNLNHFSNDRWTFSEEDKIFCKEIKEDQKNWYRSEFPKRIKDLFDRLFLLDFEISLSLTIAIIRHQRVHNLEKDMVMMEVRKSIVSKLASDPQTGIVAIDELLTNSLTKKSLLSAILLLFEAEDIDEERHQAIWRAYVDVVRQENFYWSTHIHKDEDDFTFIWLAAGTLAYLQDPLELFMDAFKQLYAPTEGWEFNSDSFFASTRRIPHLFVVGVMGAEWLYKLERKKEAEQLYDFIFEKSHTWLRSISNYYPDGISTVLTEIWARLKLIHPNSYSEKAIVTIPLFDHLEHIIVASTTLLKNIQIDNPEAKLNSELQQLVEEKYNVLYPIERVKHSHNQEVLKWYNSFDGLF